jgi:beta-glucanase (GH16 family)
VPRNNQDLDSQRLVTGVLHDSTHSDDQNKRLVWSDEFNGTSIDHTKWEREVNAFGGGNHELQMYTDRPCNVRVEDSRLILQAHREATNVAGTLRDFSSGRVRTKHRGDWTYGRFEIRAKIPEGRGLWPAIWLLPTDDHYGTWAKSGEIDIAENRGHQPRTVSGALHFGGNWPENKFVHHTVRRGIWQPKFSDEFVTYAIDWQPDRIQWVIDGRVVRERRPEHWGAPTGSHSPYDQRFHLLLNLAVGGHFPGPPSDSTRFPAAMEVDWVRVWQ